MTTQKGQVTLITGKTEFPCCSMSESIFIQYKSEANIVYGNETLRRDMPTFKWSSVGVEPAPTEDTSTLNESLNEAYGK